MRNSTAHLVANGSTDPASISSWSASFAPSGRRAALTLILSALALLVAACGATPTPSGQTTPTPSGHITPTVNPSGATIKVYFSRHPDSDSNPTKVFALTRTAPTTAVSLHDKAANALEQMLAGPTTAERAQGYYNPFDGQIALQSYCSGAFRDFDLTLDHRGATAETGTATLQFCRRVDIPGELAGPRMSTMVSSTLLQFPGVTRVVILNYRGDCFDDLQGANACLNPQQTGSAANAHFSRRADADSAPTGLFPVDRSSTTRAVATYAMSRLIARPIAVSKTQLAG